MHTSSYAISKSINCAVQTDVYPLSQEAADFQFLAAVSCLVFVSQIRIFEVENIPAIFNRE